ncbi:MAG TPA: hypothetical protein VFA85_00040 [Terriglobales bacterium]|nr:hypothetical protein [Terriglobales bacterium]
MSRWLSFNLSIAFLALPAGVANAQPASFHGPLAGFVFNGTSKTVRPLLGIPGATHVESPILTQVDLAAIAPGGKWALVVRAGHTSFISGLTELAPVESSLDGLIDAVDRVVWNRDGSFAVLSSPSKKQVQRIQISKNQATADAPVDVSPFGRVTTVAIDPTGGQIAVGFETSGLYLVADGQTPALLSPLERPLAATFGTGGSLFVVDGATQRILQFQSGAGMSEFASLAKPDGLALDPAGLAVSGDGRYLVLAESSTRSVFVYDINAQSLTDTIGLDFSPSRFERLSASPVFLLNGNDPKEWLLVLDASQTPVVYFVPAGGEDRL